MKLFNMDKHKNVARKKRLLIIGPAPQNTGGVSIHIRRLINIIKDHVTIDFVDEGRKHWDGIFNLRTLNLFKYLSKILKADIVYINSSVFILRLGNILASKLFFRKTIVNIHRDLTIENHKKITIAALKLCDKVIVVNDKTLDFLKNHIKSNRLHLIPAFLPPIINEESELPLQVNEWINTVRKSEDSILMVSNASKLVLHNGADLYGLDMCIDLISKLLEMGKDNYYLIFIVIINSDRQRLMLEGYKKMIAEAKLQERILILDEPLSFVRLIIKSDIVLRTTNTDGDAISIREGLFYGKKVIASDVVRRPEGVLTFKTRNINSLIEVVLSNTANDRNISSNGEVVDYLKLYSNILEFNI